MKIKVNVSEQVESFVKSRSPEPRKRLKRAIKGLLRGEGDIKALEGRLAGYSRLKVGGYRILFAERGQEGFRILDCLFAEARGVVYELFESLVAGEICDM